MCPQNIYCYSLYDPVFEQLQPGYYSVNAFQKVSLRYSEISLIFQRPCEAGNVCSNGYKRQCPKGFVCPCIYAVFTSLIFRYSDERSDCLQSIRKLQYYVLWRWIGKSTFHCRNCHDRPHRSLVLMEQVAQLLIILPFQVLQAGKLLTTLVLSLATVILVPGALWEPPVT